MYTVEMLQKTNHLYHKTFSIEQLSRSPHHFRKPHYANVMYKLININGFVICIYYSKYTNTFMYNLSFH